MDHSVPASSDVSIACLGRPRSICIVGGGTAGWMAACTLRRRLRCKVTVIESPRIPSIGVGEATIPAMVDWLENMQIDEPEFLRRCGGTYKLGIRFDDWITPQHRYWHPFGICGGTIDDVDLIHFWRHAQCERWIDKSIQYTEYSLQRSLCEQSLAPCVYGQKPLLSNYAFHLDAAKLAIYLREIAIAEGVQHRLAEVTRVEIDTQGAIESVVLANQSCCRADLYLDCSGFVGLLIEKAMHVPWLDWSHQLLCDRAITARTDNHDTELPPYTTSTGLSAGWAWQIPLKDNVGNGYVFSSRHQSSDDARTELLRHLGLDEERAETRELSMRIGRRERCWVSNCIAVGLSSGFIEPLESTGIFLVQRALDDLVECLPRHDNDVPNSSEFNRRMQVAYEEVRDFVLLHYVVSQRNDSSFWTDARQVSVPDSLATAMRRYEHEGVVELPQTGSVFAEANHHFIMAGAERYPARNCYRHIVDQFENKLIASREFILPLMRAIQRRNLEFCSAMSPHRMVVEDVNRACQYVPADWAMSAR